MKTFKQGLLNNQEAEGDDISPVDTWYESQGLAPLKIDPLKIDMTYYA